MRQPWRIVSALICGLASVCTGTGDEPHTASERRIVIILAPPCGGAGTQSPNIVKALSIPHLDAGHMLREAASGGTPAGLEAKKVMDTGGLVPDSITNDVVANRLRQPDCADGFLLDGYPRNLNQSKSLDSILQHTGEAVTDVVLIEVPKPGLQECVLGRWGAPNGNTYNTRFIGARRPKSLPPDAKPVCDLDDLAHCNMFDDETGEPLTRRSDDNLKTLDKRLEAYHSQTEPVLDRYQDVLIKVDGDKPEPAVWADIANSLGVDAALGLAADVPIVKRLVSPTTGLALIAVILLGAVIGIPIVMRPRGSDDDKYEALLVVT